MVYAQVHFLFWILSGTCLVSIGAILFALEPTFASCVSQNWVVTMGYTLMFVPFIVKVAAINKIIQSSQRIRRVSLNQKHLHLVVVLLATLVLMYLIIWTIINPANKQEDRILSSEGSNIVIVTLSCSSSLQTWKTMSFVWEGLLLICALVLAFQSRNIKQEFNESQSLAMMVYSHFLFMVMRGFAYFLPSSVIPSNIRAGTTSFLISFDVIFSLIIYFLPKIGVVLNNAQSRRNGGIVVSGISPVSSLKASKYGIRYSASDHINRYNTDLGIVVPEKLQNEDTFLCERCNALTERRVSFKKRVSFGAKDEIFEAHIKEAAEAIQTLPICGNEETFAPAKTKGN
mmetsp:Transcript_40500/g.59501  ORF Transcript_40500/g.59501 Transcript_40500/m.59501 type:complete len:344 (+) Transcript_40500:50-1081(+)